MGQIVQLPLNQARHLDNAATLDPAECILLVAIRWWMKPCRRDEDPLPPLSQGLEAAGTCDAASLTQSGNGHLPEKALCTALLSAPGAEFALGSLQGLGELFAEARVLFRQRQPPVMQRAPAATVESESPSALPAMIH